MREIVGFGVFCLLQIVWFPLTVVAYVLFVVKLIAYSRHTGASATVLASFYPRWMQHQLRTRRDVACVRLMRVMPNIPQAGLGLITAPTRLAHRLTGYVPRIYRYPFPGQPAMNDQPAARITYFDEALAHHLPEIKQLVVLGAGLDTRAYRLPADSPVRCFEVDTPWTQPFKRTMAQKAGLPPNRVTYVAADFEREDWYEKLVAAGFDPGKPSFFLWESVTMYLDRPAVESTLRTIAGSAPGSAVAFDYFSTEFLKSRAPFWSYARVILKAVGEPFGTFGIESTPPVREHVRAFVEACGLSLEEQRNFGTETTEQQAPAGFATATVQPAPCRDLASAGAGARATST